jgi:hypothetical protein
MIILQQGCIRLVLPACMNAHMKIGYERMRFEIYDGKRHQEVSAGETDHCKYEFWLNVN